MGGGEEEEPGSILAMLIPWQCSVIIGVSAYLRVSPIIKSCGIVYTVLNLSDWKATR